MPPIPDYLLKLVDDPGTTDIFLSGDGTEVHSGAGVTSLAPIVESEAEVGDLARELIELGGRRLDQAQPFADVYLPGGLRVHAVLKSGCSSKTQISIRLHNQIPLSLAQLYQRQLLTEAELGLVEEIIANRESFLICGATGSGKTTLLRAMIAELTERVITIEDVTEITGPGIISLQTRSPNIEGQGEVGVRELIRQALRMRPDRLVVGEVRGLELIDMLQALNTGHRGATTIHANLLTRVPERLYSIAAIANLSDKALARLTKSAFDWVIAIEQFSGKREIVGIGKFEIESDLLVVKEQQGSCQ